MINNSKKVLVLKRLSKPQTFKIGLIKFKKWEKGSKTYMLM